MDFLEFFSSFGTAGLITFILIYDRRILLDVLRRTDKTLHEINMTLAVIKDRLGCADDD
jgi:hypothetical protein